MIQHTSIHGHAVRGAPWGPGRAGRFSVGFQVEVGGTPTEYFVALAEGYKMLTSDQVEGLWSQRVRHLCKPTFWGVKGAFRKKYA
jgi:hypothetical protein